MDNGKRFDELVERRVALMRETLQRKATEYATGRDRYHNFRAAARILGTTPEEALVGMLAKHVVSVLDLVDWANMSPRRLTPGLVDEKIGDAVNYLVLLEGLLNERILDMEAR